jgi:8-oxo-dGTP pyrophosphatase MutT (NUDIX family)
VIRFDRGTFRFNYRVVGVALHDGKVLLHRAGHEDFWSLPGGRAELGETSEETLRREMREELDVDVEVVRPLWFVETFFDYDSMSYHEVAIYFLMHLPDGSAPQTSRTFTSIDAGVTLLFEWFPAQPAVLAALPLMPSFLAEGLCDLPPSMMHVVHRDEVKRRLLATD